MGNDTADITTPAMTTFHVRLLEQDALAYIREGMLKLCGDNMGVAASHSHGDDFVPFETLSLQLLIPAIHCIEVFTYLFHCMEFGYIILLSVDPILGTKKAMFPGDDSEYTGRYE